MEFADSVSWQALDSAWTGTDSFQVLGQGQYSLPHDNPVNDPFYDRQDYLMGYDGSQNVIQAWPLSKGNPNVKVCVIDDGIDKQHYDLVNRWAAGYDGEDNLEVVREFLRFSARYTRVRTHCGYRQ